MAEYWVRLWAGMTTDPKWKTISRKSGRPVTEVIAVFTHALMLANESAERGHLYDTWETEDVASALDMEEEHVESIRAAMEGRVIQGDYLTGWDSRQPARNDEGDQKTGAKSAAERKREQRAREKSQPESANVTTSHGESRNVTTSHAPEAEAEAEADVNPLSQAAASNQPESRAIESAAALPDDPVTARAIELTGILRKRGAALQASNPTVRAWAACGVTDAQALTALEIAGQRRSDAADHRPINAGYLDAIMQDVVRPQNPRASPEAIRRKSVSDDRKSASMILTGRKPENERPISNSERDITADCQRIT